MPQVSFIYKLVSALLIGISLLLIPAFSQQSVQKHSADAERAIELIAQADSMVQVNPTLALAYYREADSICRSTGNDSLFLTMYSYYTWALNNASQFDSSLSISQRALAIAEKRKNSTEIAFAFTAIGLVYVNKSFYQLALDNYFRAMNALEGSGQPTLLCRLYGRISGCYYPLKLYARSLEYELKAQACFKPNDTIPLCNSYFNTGLLYKELGNYGEAMRYYNLAEELNASSGAKIMECRLQFAMAALMNAQEKHQDAITYARKGVDLSRSIQFESGMAMSLAELGRAYWRLGRNKEAKNYLTQSVNLSVKNNLAEELLIALDPIRFVEAAIGDLHASDRYDKMYRKLTDSIFNQQSSSNIQELESRYQNAKKEAEITRLQDEKKLQDLSLQKKSILNALLIGGALILLIILILVYVTYRQKQKLQHQKITELEAEKKLMATEAVLRGEEQERTRLARDLHDGLGGMLSGIKYTLNTMKGNLIMTPDNAQAFERSMDMLDSSIKELRRVAHNMMPEALVKFGLDTALRDFCNDIRQSGSLLVTYQSIGLESGGPDQSVSIIIYRVIQELIHNIIKHAGATTAIVQVSRTNGHISITVEDDGKGFDPAILERARGIGWNNIQNRVEYLKGKVDVQSAPGKGSSILIEFNDAS